MLIYNVTTIIEPDIQQDYLDYMKNEHMPEVMATAKFINCNLFQLTEPVNEGLTYCAQYVANTQEDLEDYRQNHSPALQAKFQIKFPAKVVAFRSILEKI
jgi:hypothetical protein